MAEAEAEDCLLRRKGAGADTETETETEAVPMPARAAQAGKRRKIQKVSKGCLANKPDAIVAIVGGGIGGLAAALALNMRGIKAHVYEKDPEFHTRRHGYGLTLSTTNVALEQLGLMEDIMRHETESQSHYVFGPDGAVLGYFGTAFNKKKPTGQRGNLRVPRQVLRQILLDRLPAGTVRWGKRIATFAEDEGAAKVALTFADGSAGEYDALVGADGINSRIRKERVDDGRKYLGVMAVVGLTSHEHPLLHQRGFYTVDGTHRLFTMPFANATDSSPAVTMFQLTYNCAEDVALELAAQSNADILAVIRGKCGAWHDPVPGMLKEMDAEEIWARPLYDRDPMPPPKKGSRSLVTLLGDAAHPMSPFKGQGANTALFDAAHLAEKLATLPVTSALATYEREMVARSSKRVLKSREARGLLHGPAVFEDKAFGIAGVHGDDIGLVLAALRADDIGANRGAELDASVAEAIAAVAGEVPSK